MDQADAPAVSISAWVDVGNSTINSRLFRGGYSSQDPGTCGGWTISAATAKPDGFTNAVGWTFNTFGVLGSSFVTGSDGGCENTRPLACCQGGTAIRFRGFTPSTTGGNLGGRTGANALCRAAFAGSHFCADWEADQGAVPAPIPATGAWIDVGDSSNITRLFRGGYSIQDPGTCAGWTTSAATAKPDGFTNAVGWTLTPLGGLANTFITGSDGGCEVARPLACCDGYPPM
jgi:hypothetical protein